MKLKYFFFFYLLSLAIYAQSDKLEVRGLDKSSIDFEEFKLSFNNPSQIYAPFMFWFWDTIPDKYLVKSMAENMCLKGINPGYIHARKGLDPNEWLNDNWFESINEVSEVCTKNGFYFGYCDEYWWPSGRANGRVIKENPNLKAYSLEYKKNDLKQGESITINNCEFAVAAQIDTIYKTISFLRRIKSNTLEIISNGVKYTNWTAPSGEWRVYVFNKYKWPGLDGGDVNYLDKDLIDVFYKIAHHPYVNKFKNSSGKQLASSFVDNEGDYGYKLAWSEDLKKEYRKIKGNDIRLYMPLLIDEDLEGQYIKYRYDWFDVVSDLYSKSYIGGISKRLEEKNIYYVSNLWEENLLLQAMLVGSLFKCQRQASIPGIDALDSRALNVHDFKETQSVCEFEQKPFQCEILGVAGWDLTPELMKQAVNNAIACGVTHFVPHGINLKRDIKKIDFPPDMYQENPYWDFIDIWADFIKRASYINSFGSLKSKVIILNPMTNIWAITGGSIFDRKSNLSLKDGLMDKNAYKLIKNGNQINIIEESYSGLLKNLSDNNIEYLIGDEEYFFKSEIKGDKLNINKFSFELVVIPDVNVVSYELMKKLYLFAKAGGKVVFCGNKPENSIENGINDIRLKILMSQMIQCNSVFFNQKKINEWDLNISIDNYKTFKFERGKFQVASQNRIIGDKSFIYFANSTNLKQEAIINIPEVKGNLYKWDIERGIIIPIDYKMSEKFAQIELKMNPLESFWLVFDPNDKTKQSFNKKNEIKIINIINGNWKVELDTNFKPLFNPIIPYDLKKESEKPLEDWSKWGLRNYSGFLIYKNDFILNNTIKNKIFIDLGKVKHMAEVYINGKLVGRKLWGDFEFDITNYCVKGINKIEIKVGNLFCNAVDGIVWHETNPRPTHWKSNYKQEKLESGLFGPVTIYSK